MTNQDTSGRLKESLVGVAALFASTGTLVCCALPILLVALGLGSVVAGLAADWPWLIALTRHKIWIFAGSALLLGVTAWVLYRPGRSCPVEPVLAAHCARLDRWNRRVYWSTVAIWIIGFAAAYLALPIRKLLEV